MQDQFLSVQFRTFPGPSHEANTRQLRIKTRLRRKGLPVFCGTKGARPSTVRVTSYRSRGARVTSSVESQKTETYEAKAFSFQLSAFDLQLFPVFRVLHR